MIGLARLHTEAGRGRHAGAHPERPVRSRRRPAPAGRRSERGREARACSPSRSSVWKARSTAVERGPQAARTPSSCRAGGRPQRISPPGPTVVRWAERLTTEAAREPVSLIVIQYVNRVGPPVRLALSQRRGRRRRPLGCPARTGGRKSLTATPPAASLGALASRIPTAILAVRAPSLASRPRAALLAAADRAHPGRAELESGGVQRLTHLAEVLAMKGNFPAAAQFLPAQLCEP